MFRIDSHLLKTLRDGGYSLSDIEEIKRRLNAGPIYLAALRDEFAKAALTGMLANPNFFGGPAVRAREAYGQADAMLAARGKGGAA
jgi:hypothetical protein